DRRDVAQGLPTQPVGSNGESSPVVVSEPQPPPTGLSPEEAVLLDQIGERIPLLVIQPAGDGEKQQPKGRHVDHERELISRTPQKMSEMLAVLGWDNTGSDKNRPACLQRDLVTDGEIEISLASENVEGILSREHERAIRKVRRFDEIEVREG